MLQQTRVETVIPYYDRFISRFPDAASLAAAPEPEVLALWSGLGYYSRARNLQRTARLVASGFPADYKQILALPGVGPYTAAAVASIAFGLPYAAVDGNVMRVITRLTGDDGDIGTACTRQRIASVAARLVDPVQPGDFNQSMMDLGATVCLPVPRTPRCAFCPVARGCRARLQERQGDLPVKRPKISPNPVMCAVVVLRRRDRLLLWQRPLDSVRMAGFWELPALDDVPGVAIARDAGEFTHTIVNTRYRVRVHVAARARRVHFESGGAAARIFEWFSRDELARIPLTTVTKKALKLV